MKRTTYQVPELRDENDNIIQQGAFGKNTALANSTNDGWIDYVANDLEALHDAQTAAGNAITTGTLTVTGDVDITKNLSVSGAITGNVTGNVTGNADTATNATNDSNGDKIDTTYMPIAGGTFTGYVNGVTPTAGDNSTKIATTEFVNAKAGNYLPLSGGRINGDLSFTGGSRKINFSNGKSQVVGYGNGVYVYGDTANKQSSFVAYTNENGSGFQINAGDGTTQHRMVGKPDGTLTWDGNNILTAANYNSYALPLSGGTLTGMLTNNGSNYIPINIKTTGTNYRDIQIESSDGNHRIATIRASKTSEGRCEITIGASTTSNEAPTGITISRSTTDIYATAPTPGETDNSTKIATTAFVRSIIPAGVVLAYAKGAVPTGWLLCDGSAVSRTDYAALFAVIGTTYGAGNGSTTFNLPNLVDKFVEGSATAGTVKNAGLPNITGMAWGLSGEEASKGYNDGSALRWNQDKYTAAESLVSSSGKALRDITFSASWCNSIYGNSTTVQPPALTMRYIIKY